MRGAAAGRSWKKPTGLRPGSFLHNTSGASTEAAGTNFKAKQWAAAVERAKVAVAELHKYRRIVAQEALKVCDIVQGGGGHWTDHADVYTVRKFAEDIGVNYKTLWNWINVERDIVPRLEPGEYSEEDYKFAQKAIKDSRSSDSPTAIVDRFRILKSENKSASKLSTILQWTRSHASFLKKAAPKDLPAKDLHALRGHLVEMTRLIDVYLPKAKT